MLQYITSESVTSGHPDKICDQISDSILDACLSEDPFSRVGCECLAANDNLVIAWEITTKAKVDYIAIAKKTIKEIWYDSDEKFYNADKINYYNFVHTQSSDIAAWVDTGWAGDQWIMYGYATNETKRYMPLPIDIAHKLWEKLEEVRKTWEIDYIYPDGKTQVTVIYDENLKAVWIDTVLISTQHAKWVNQDVLKQDLVEKVITPTLADFGYNVKDVAHIYTNPTGIFNIGWPVGDSWLTGRKIIVDTYGWVGRHGGWAFSGKDPTKVDRSWAYIARYLAKNIVASGVCDRCEIQLSYAIWIANPISVFVDCFGTNKVSIDKIINAVKTNFDLSPAWIIAKLDLRKPIYKKTASFWHFWREEFSWEKLDSVGGFKGL